MPGKKLSKKAPPGGSGFPGSAGALPIKKKSPFAKLDERIQKIGTEMAKRTAGRKPLSRVPKQPEHRDDYFKEIRQGKRQFKKSSFKGQYRGFWMEMDELVSAATVRELVDGILNKYSGKLSPKDEIELNDILNDISRVRMPTGFVGYSYKDKSGKLRRMQHPTSLKNAVFTDPKLTASAHSNFDIERRKAIVDEMENAVKNGSTPREVAEAGIRRAISYTLNEGAAPVSASDIRPHARLGGKGKVFSKIEQMQVRARESLKKIFNNLGGTQEPGPADPERDWSDRPGMSLRDVSAPRPI